MTTTIMAIFYGIVFTVDYWDISRKESLSTTVMPWDKIKRYRDELGMTPDQLGSTILALVDYIETGDEYDGDDAKIARLFYVLEPWYEYTYKQYIENKRRMINNG